MPDTPIKKGIAKLQPFFMEKLKERVLYHYTTLPTFGEFMKDDAQFFCTHYAALNDSSEIKCGIDTICEHFKREIKILPELCNHLKQCLVIGRTEGIIRPTWVMSFSLEKDSLYQWGLYTDRQNGGFAIGFDSSVIQRIVDESNCEKCRPHWSLHLLPCLYTETNKAEIKTFLEIVFDKDDNAVKHLKDKGVDDSDATRAILARMVLVSCLIKDDSFASENEVRLVVDPVYKDYENVALIGGKPRWNTQLFPSDKKPLRSYINEIWVSPHGFQELLKATAEMMKMRHGLHYDIKPSESPYNGR